MGEGGNILEGDLLKSRISDRIPDHRYVIYTSRGTRVADVQPRPWRSIDPPRICPPFQVVVRHEGAVVTETIAPNLARQGPCVRQRNGNRRSHLGWSTEEKAS